MQITGFPYFPGVVVGRLHVGSEGDTAERILLLSQEQAARLGTLPAGIIVVDAMPFSHTMIGVLGLGVPTVLITAQQAAMLPAAAGELLIDGSRGVITTDVSRPPPARVLRPNPEAGQPVLLADGQAVALSASVRQPSMAKQARALGAESIGLVRSEFLLPADDVQPGVEFFLNAFRSICEAASPLPVTFRLLDLAPDKMPPWLTKLGLAGQATGMQGVRSYHLEPVRAVVQAQVLALAMLADEFPLRVLLPYLVRLEEFDYWLQVVRRWLPGTVAVGAMAETLAMVLDIEHVLADADFVAIGCNDLMQNIYMADRDQANLRDYLDPYAPVLFRLFRQVAEAAGEQIDRVLLCGVLPQIQGVMPVMLGLGYRHFSVDAPFIPHLANAISTLTATECRALSRQVCDARETIEVVEILQVATDRHAPFIS